MPYRDPASARAWRQKHKQRRNEARKARGWGAARRRELRNQSPEARERWREQKRRYRRNADPLVGKRRELNAAAAAARREQRKRDRRPRASKDRWIERLRSECPEAYVPTLSRDGLVYRARYLFDPVFKAREIERTRRRKALTCGVRMRGDGSLHGTAVQRLFAAAKRCPDCRKRLHPRDKTLDHIVPLSRGGAHSLFNARVVCKRCNTKKGARLPDQLVLSWA